MASAWTISRCCVIERGEIEKRERNREKKIEKREKRERKRERKRESDEPADLFTFY